MFSFLAPLVLTSSECRHQRSLPILCYFQDGRADVVANDAGDRVTPAVVAYRDTEQVLNYNFFPI